MASRSIQGTAILAAILIAAMTEAREQQGGPEAADIPDPAIETAFGIRTDRLSARQLRVWEDIRRIVFANDTSGRFSHPRLQSLWQWVETSGHVIYAELPDPRDRCDHQAGRFRIERPCPDGHKCVAVIRLCLPVIDGARIKARARGEDGFIQYEGLSREERYAEALGHELAHAVWVLSDRGHARLIDALDGEVEEFYSRRREAVHGTVWDEKARQQLSRIQSLTSEFEAPAETAEAEVWQELLKSRGRR